ncbi:hypothetical protein FJZ31_21235 [Candidatus Poribacteria bacterium]|nr:hypothetical protein [Candidatus Poribacteria bacterium]
MNETSQEHKILIGWASKSITPSKPVALSGQFHVRVSKYVHDPIMATALAIEAAGEQAIMVSCDIVGIEEEIQDKLRSLVKHRLSGFDVKKLFLNTTHTHTAPVMVEGQYPPQGKEVMTPTEYVDFFLNCVSDAVVEAWESREPGGVSWALGHAVVGHNRRAAYFDGSARMYGSTNREDFDCIEGYEDHSLDMLFLWDQEQKLTGIVINLACPSQVTEGEYYVSADFWHEVRTELRKRYSDNLFVLSQCAAAGDQSPHFLLHGRAEESMRKRKGVSEREEIAIRIANAVDYVFPLAKSDIRTDVPFKHIVQEINLPVRKVTEKEVEQAKLEYDRLMKKQPIDSAESTILRRNKNVMERYEQQETFYQMELHVIRLGDIAIATNPFELFLDFGLRIKARSKALQTFIVQLACGYSGYLPTAKAVAAGGYGAEIPSNRVGPEGGQELVNQTVKLISQ